MAGLGAVVAAVATTWVALDKALLWLTLDGAALFLAYRLAGNC
jgi:hypothetical protein